jgi:hypothetical protein
MAITDWPEFERPRDNTPRSGLLRRRLTSGLAWRLLPAYPIGYAKLTFSPQGGGRGCTATKVSTTTHRLCRSQKLPGKARA